MDQKSPDAFRTISEVSEWLDTPAHVLRFWESRFPQVKPVKRAGGRRYYRPSDMALLGGIKKLLHEDGMTIRGVQKILRSEGTRYVASLSPSLDDLSAPMVEDAEEEAPAAEVISLRGPREASASETGRPSSHPEAAEAAAEAEPPSPARQDTPREREPEFFFDSPPSEPETAAAEPAAPALAAVPEVPPDDDPGFAPALPVFPLRDPSAVRERMKAKPHKATALYSRLVDLHARMAERPR